jgi:hypothetical protein
MRRQAGYGMNIVMTATEAADILDDIKQVYVRQATFDLIAQLKMLVFEDKAAAWVALMRSQDVAELRVQGLIECDCA